VVNLGTSNFPSPVQYDVCSDVAAATLTENSFELSSSKVSGSVPSGTEKFNQYPYQYIGEALYTKLLLQLVHFLLIRTMSAHYLKTSFSFYLQSTFR
jgi:hypothetical protein